MLVHIVYVPDATRLGPDLTRMGKVEDMPEEVARKMIDDGSARWPTDDERDAYVASAASKATAAGPASTAPPKPVEDTPKANLAT